MRKGPIASLLFPAFCLLQACDGQGNSVLMPETSTAGKPEAPIVVIQGEPVSGPFTVSEAYVGTWSHAVLKYDTETYRSYYTGEIMKIDVDGIGTLTFPSTDSTGKRTFSLRLSGKEPIYEVTLMEGSFRLTGTLSLEGNELFLAIENRETIRFIRYEPLKASAPE